MSLTEPPINDQLLNGFALALCSVANHKYSVVYWIYASIFCDPIYFISLRLVKVFGIWVAETTFMLEGWIQQDTFTAHSQLLPIQVLVSYLG